MSAFLDKQVIPTAQEPRNKFDLSHTHVSSGDFFETGVSWIHEMTPGSRIDVDLEVFSRLEAMPTPTFGRARIVTRAFAVPMRLVYPAWEEFMSDTVNIPADNDLGNLQTKVPWCTNNELCQVFTDSVTASANDFLGDGMLTPTSSGSYDVDFGGNHYDYTFYGRQAIKLLRQLGYSPVYDIGKDYDWDLNCMPLLALARTFAEYYYPAQYHDYASYDRLMRLCKVNLSAMTTGIHLSPDDIRGILNICSWTYHDSSLWCNAWDTPNSPSTGLHTDFRLKNIDSVRTLRFGSANNNVVQTENGYVTNNSGAAIDSNRVGGADAAFISPYVTYNPSTGASNSTPISNFLIESLFSLSDFLKRNQMAGARPAERLLSRYGVPTPTMRYNRVQYLGAYSQDVQIGDVMSTSDTSGEHLGGFAGRGISFGSNKFSYETSESCYLMFITTILPQDGTGVQGIHPQCLRLFKNSYFIPEFDQMGTEPLESLTLYTPRGGVMSTFQGIGSQIFGFIPRYGTYKFERDALSGVYDLPSVQGAVPGGSAVGFADSSWNLFRLFSNSDFPQGAQDMVHSLDFMWAGNDCLQYKRLFYANDADAPDNFRLVFNFQVAEWANMKPLYDTYDFHTKSNKDVTLEVNGVRAN